MNCTCMVELRLLVNENMAELVFYEISITMVMLGLMLVVDTEELVVFVTYVG